MKHVARGILLLLYFSSRVLIDRTNARGGANAEEIPVIKMAESDQETKCRSGSTRFLSINVAPPASFWQQPMVFLIISSKSRI